MAITSSIANFRSNFQGGTRPNRFLVEGKIGGQGGNGLEDFDLAPYIFLIKATSLPASTIGIIPVPYRGRVLKIPGDRMFAEWAITIIDDADTSIQGGGKDVVAVENLRSKFTKWSNSINGHVTNITSDPNMSSLAKQWTVSMLSQKGKGAGTPDEKIRTIKLHNCWPIEIAAVDLSYDTADTITEFTVNLAYDFWTEEGKTT